MASLSTAICMAILLKIVWRKSLYDELHQQDECDTTIKQRGICYGCITKGTINGVLGWWTKKD